MPTVPCPVPYRFPSRTEPNLNSGDSRYGFYLPPVPDTLVPAPMACRPSQPFNPIDPVLLSESQSQSLCRPPVVYRSLSSQARQMQHSLVSFSPGQSPTPRHSLDMDNGDNSEGDEADESEDEYESEGRDSDDEEEQALSSHSDEYVRKSFPVDAHGPQRLMTFTTIQRTRITVVNCTTTDLEASRLNTTSILPPLTPYWVRSFL